MKQNPIAVALVAVLLVNAVATAVLAVAYTAALRDMRKMQPRITQINNNRALVQSLANDVLEHSKRNPAVDPLLQSVGLKAGKPAASPAPAAPAKQPNR